MKKILAGFWGILIGLATFYLMYGWYDVFPWALVALAIGYASKTRRESIISGAIFGYTLFLAYIYLGYKGKTDTDAMTKFVLFDAAFSLVGALAGAIGAFIGNWLRGKFGKSAD
jgi:hypothetical protein